MTSELAYYTAHSPVTDPGPYADILAEVPADLAAIKAAIFPLVFHYRADGDWAEQGVAPERVAEINLRYVESMMARLQELAPVPLGTNRQPNQRVVGCCRDFSVLTVSLCRQLGIPARMRVGFAAYFVPGWWMDHAVAEIWDATELRWRLVDAELGDEHPDSARKTTIDPLDVPRDRFLTGPDAWRAARRGDEPAERFVVSPELEVPQLRSWPYLCHNLVHDLASLNNHEMILWDVWGLDGEDDVPNGQEALLDEIAAADTREARQALFARDDLRVPPVVQSFSPENPFPPREVTLRQVIRTS